MSDFLDKDAILESLTEEDVIKIVMDLGSARPKTGTKGELIFQTVCHNPTNGKYKLYYYHEANGDYPSRVFHCYTECSDTFNIYELVIRAKAAQSIKIGFYQAVRYVANLTKNVFYAPDKKQESKIEITSDWDWINRLKNTSLKEQKSIPEFKKLDERILELFCFNPIDDWINNHITVESMRDFEIGYYGKTNQIIIPHRDMYSNLIGIRGRFLNEEDIEAIGKYVPMLIEGNFLSHSLGSNFYGIHKSINKIKQCKKVLLLESEKGKLQNHSYFGEDDFSLSTCGSSITAIQIQILLQVLGVEEVILGFDKEYIDPESFMAELYWNKLLKKVAPLIPYCNVSIIMDKKGLLGYKDSPTDRGKDTLLDLLENKIQVTMKDLEKLNEIKN